MKSNFKLLLLIGLILPLAQCSKKITEAPVKVEEEVVVEKDPTNPCKTFSDLSGYDRDQAETAYVLYKDELKLNNYKSALSIWRKAYSLAPGSNGRVKSQFDDGVTLYSELIKQSNDEALNKRYVDTIMMIQSKREECFGTDASYEGKKAFDYYYNLSKYVDEEKIYATFKKSIDIGNGKAEYFVINPMAKIIHDRVLEGKISNDEGRKYAKYLTNSLNQGLATCQGEQCDSWKIIKEYTPDILASLEGVDDFYDCAYYSDKYYELFKASPTDCEVITTALARMLRGKCDMNDAKLLEVKSARDKNCQVAPPPPGTLKQAYDAYSNGSYREAVRLFDQFVNESDEPEKKAKYSLLIAKIYYGDIKDFPKSRSYALNAASFKSNWGEPYLLIGKLYASSGPLCGPGRGWDSQIVTWPAIDKFEYAKSIDAGLASEANKLIATYKQYMPSKEDIFFRGISAGSSYTVPCWIQERTTVRTSD